MTEIEFTPSTSSGTGDSVFGGVGGKSGAAAFSSYPQCPIDTGG
ncbi:hypothetical protein [Cognataquiflexum rubidum]|nr:hypothetical protein [Cognataquiflexum rubidum]